MSMKWLFRIVSTAAVILWMCLVFGFSGQKAEQSTGLSTRVSIDIVETVNEIGHQNWSEETVTDYAKKIEYPVRKCAHMTEYAILALLVFGMLGSYGMRVCRLRYQIAVVYVFVYASTDEFHQLFVAGRSGQFSDVCIDTIGTVIAMLLLYGLIHLVQKRRTKA